MRRERQEPAAPIPRGIQLDPLEAQPREEALHRAPLRAQQRHLGGRDLHARVGTVVPDAKVAHDSLRPEVGLAFLHLILDIPAEEVRMGMRVEAVWKPREEWGTTIENISHFRPTGEPDADYETYKHHQ